MSVLLEAQFHVRRAHNTSLCAILRCANKTARLKSLPYRMVRVLEFPFFNTEGLQTWEVILCGELLSKLNKSKIVVRL